MQRILSRVFGINVVHAMVITDIDDKIIKRSLEVIVYGSILVNDGNKPWLTKVVFVDSLFRDFSPSLQENISPTILARMYEEEFKCDMLSLKVGDCCFESSLLVYWL